MKTEKKKDKVERPNKSQIKREMQELFEQAVYICELRPEKIIRLNLHPAVLDAIEELNRIKSINARKRHIQYITRLLSEQNNLEDIQAILFEYQNPHILQQQIDRKIDKISEKLLEGEQNAIDDFFAHSPSLDRQNFLQILRNAQKEYQQLKSVIPELDADIFEPEHTVTKAPDGKQTKKLKKILRESLKKQVTNQ